MAGSSPRLWGTCLSGKFPELIHRFIPTPVGNIAQGTATELGSTVHPHACGEHEIGRKVREELGGSSPRLWGTLEYPPSPPAQTRFIPTPVGNMPLPAPWSCSRTVHPHACGEHNGIAINRWAGAVHPHACGEHGSTATVTAIENGSSPRLWGTFNCCVNYALDSRFIPTPVGNIYPRQGTHGRQSVHPHACGEHDP